MNQVLLIDHSTIPVSLGSKSLFVNGICVAGTDTAQPINLERLAENLAKSLDCRVATKYLSEHDLGRYRAANAGLLPEFQRQAIDTQDFANWVDGFTDDELLGAVNFERSPTTSTVIADFEIRDWHLAELGEGWTGPRGHRASYRFVMEQSPSTKQLHFRCYPATLDHLSELPQVGLAGCIEVRNGKPALSVGLHEDELCVHLESDGYKGIYTHWDLGAEPISCHYFSFDHGMTFESHFYPCVEDTWLMEARSELANKLFEQYNFGDAVVVDDSGWEIADTDWSKTVYFENPLGGDSIRGKYRLTFAENSVVVVDQSSSI